MDIFDFSDYRIYLKQWLLEARKASGVNLSRLAEAAGVHTTYLSHVMSGNKNLNLEQATLISETLSHTKLERDFFFALIELERAGTEKLRQYWREKMNALKGEREKLSSRVGEHHQLSDTERSIFYSSWIYVALFVATSLDDGQTLDEIAKLFQLSRDSADRFLNFLVKTGICELKDGKYRMGHSVVYVPNDSPFVVKHHTNWRMKAIQKMDTRESRELFYTSPMSISRNDFEKIRTLLAESIQKSLAICKDSPAEEVVCLNIDFFAMKV